eukprot:scaffold5588_cov62-Phaeocystis_antarctica.AAC.1
MPPPPDAVARRAAIEAAAAARGSGSPRADALALNSTRGGKKRLVCSRARSGGARSGLTDQVNPWRAGLARDEPAPPTAEGDRDGGPLRATPRLRGRARCGSGALSGGAAAAARRGHFAGGDFTFKTPPTYFATELTAEAVTVAAANAQHVPRPSSGAGTRHGGETGEGEGGEKTIAVRQPKGARLFALRRTVVVRTMGVGRGWLGISTLVACAGSMVAR